MIDTVIIPGTGVVVSLDADAQEIARAWDELLQTEREVKSVKREIADEITRRLDHEGRRSMTLDGVKFETSAPTEKQWNMPLLQATLTELVGEGTISHKKAEACLKWEPKASWAEIKTLLSDPRCQARLNLTFEEVPASRYGKVSHA